MTEHMVEVILPDGKSRHIASDRPVRETLGDVLPPGCLAVRIAGRLGALDAPAPTDGPLDFIDADSREALVVLRRTAAQALSLAVHRLFDEVETANLKVSDDGFWCEFDLPHTIKSSDLPILGEEMERIIAEDLPLSTQILNAQNAEVELRRQRSRFRIERLREEGGDIFPFVSMAEIFEPARGPHLDSTSQIPAFAILEVSGAYWRDDERRDMLQRIWATAFFSTEELQDYLRRREEARERDHRKLGRKMDLFRFLPEAPGTPFWLPGGVALLNELKNLVREHLNRTGHQEIQTPTVLPQDLWQKSGHLDHYQDRMFHLEGSEATHCLKPMNCPGAILLYRSALRSYRDLPIRLSEFGHVHRNERSGVLSGLFRVRSFTQDDGHSFVLPEGLETEIQSFLHTVGTIYGILGFEEFGCELSTRPPRSIGTEASWDEAEAALIRAIKSSGRSFEIVRGAGAFYGPKIDLHLRDCLGRTWQCGTVQIDFSMPERFDLTYVDPAGRHRRPVLIHRALLGSFERFLGILLENTRGDLPVWLAPEQVRIVPVSETRFGQAARNLADFLTRHGIRARTQKRPQRIGYEVRQAQEARIPYLLVVGETEIEEDSVSVRIRGHEQPITMPLQEFCSFLRQQIDSRSWRLEP
ncbi:MAG: threonine--tRNA ligase [Planctomycetota bacterium]|nr:threonine--tRNA ligase [Planctomycetota bacterium]